MLDLRKMIQVYQKEGLAIDLASARVSQDIILLAIASGPLNRNITIKGGVVMRSITNNNRRATRDIDLDFIHYSLADESIKSFVEKMNCIDGIRFSIDSEIEELKHQDYHGKSVIVKIEDQNGTVISSKMDIGVHKHFEIEQEEYCFDVAMNESGVCLLRNTVEQAFVEKLRSLLIFGSNSRRYKDIFDMYYLKNIVNGSKIQAAIQLLIFSDKGIRENNYSGIIKRIETTFKDKQYLHRVSNSRQRWFDEDIRLIADGILNWLKSIANQALENKNNTR